MILSVGVVVSVPKSSDLANLVLISGAAFGCLAPTAWVSFPAAVLLVLWLPGRLLVQALRPINTMPGGFWLAISTSILLSPIPLSWFWRFSNSRPTLLIGLVALNLLLLIVSRRTEAVPKPAAMFSSTRQRWLFAALILFVGACVFGSYWLPEAGGRIGTRAAGDYVKHHAVLWSLERYPLPLHSVFYAEESATPYYYYHYHHLVAAALRKLAADRVSIGFALGVTSAVVTSAFIAVVFLLARGVPRLASSGGALFAAACASIVGGWDIIPVLIRTAFGAKAVVVLDSWCPIPWRIHNLSTQFQWCPQHVAGTLAIALAALWLRQAPSARWWIILAPLLAASLFGSSVYLAMTAFPAALVYVLIQYREARGDHARRRALLVALPCMAGLGLAMMGLQAWEYRLMSLRAPGGLTCSWDRLDLALIGQLVPPGVLANFLDAPWMFLVDFGLPALACVLVTGVVWRSFWRDAGLRFLLIVGILGILTVYTIRSDHSRFDYSFRLAVMPTQVVGALLAGALLVPDYVRPCVRRWRRAILVAGVVLGLPAGLYEAPLMAVRSLLQTPVNQSEAGAIRFLRDRTPAEIVVQRAPEGPLGLPQLIDRQLGVSDPTDSHVRVFYPRDMEKMERLYAGVEHAFSTASSRQAYEALRAAHITHVLVGDLEQKRYGLLGQFDDPRWFERVYTDERARVYRLLEAPASGPMVPNHPEPAKDEPL